MVGFFLSATLSDGALFAADPTVAGTAAIGTLSPSWSGLWDTNGAASVWQKYTIIRGATNNTYVNAVGSGSIVFRLDNSGPLSGDPDGSRALGWIDNSGTFHAYSLVAKGGTIGPNGLSVTAGPGGDITSRDGAIFGQNNFPQGYGVTGSGNDGGVKGTTSGGAGVFGTAQSGTGVYGVSTSAIGVFGQGHTDGVRGVSSTGFAVQGINLGQNWAGYFNGTTLGNYGKGTTYGVYSDGPIYVNSASTTKVGGSSMWTTGSDARIKKDVVDFHGGLAELEKVRPVRFKYNGLGGTQDDNQVFVGVIAQELEPIAPYMVTSAKRKLHDGDKALTDIRQVDPNAFMYMLINSVKELAQENRKLAEQNRQVVRVVCASHSGNALCNSAKMALRR
jgi:hypothetical protein